MRNRVKNVPNPPFRSHGHSAIRRRDRQGYISQSFPRLQDQLPCLNSAIGLGYSRKSFKVPVIAWQIDASLTKIFTHLYHSYRSVSIHPPTLRKLSLSSIYVTTL